MYTYLASTDTFLKLGLVKIGCTKNPRNRLNTYLTGSQRRDGFSYEVFVLPFETSNFVQR